jgi:hypothetical protein
MRVLVAVIACVIASACASSSSPTDYSQASIEQLIDQLTLVDAQAPGLHGTADVEDFIADDTPPRFGGGLIGSQAPVIPPQMRELVRRGAESLPALIRHLDDQRPTKFSVGSTLAEGLEGRSFIFFSQNFAEEYDPRVRTSPQRDLYQFDKPRPFDGSYTLRVGDVSYALIGQIVNRRLWTIRYQPTANLIVNSPLQSPSLIAQIRRDWGATDQADLRDSLLSDLRGNYYEFNSALSRLRVFYPETYNNLGGLDLKKCLAFEHEEREYQNAASVPQRDVVVARPLNQNVAGCRTLAACLERIGENIHQPYVDWDSGEHELTSKLREFGEAAKQDLLMRATDPDSAWRSVSTLVLRRWEPLSDVDLPPLLDAFHMRELFAAYAIARIDSSVGMQVLMGHFEIWREFDVVADALTSAGAKALPYLFPLLEKDDDSIWIPTVNVIRNMRANAAPGVDAWVSIASDVGNPPRQRLAAMRGLSGMVDNLPHVRALVAPLTGDFDPAIAELAQQIARTP